MKDHTFETFICRQLHRQPWTHSQCTRWVFFWAILPSPLVIYYLSSDLDIGLPGTWIIFGMAATLCYVAIWLYLRQFFVK